MLLPSPLLPTTLYQDLLSALRVRGCHCAVADASDARSGDQLIDRWAAAASPDMKFIAHSNAGYLAPGVRAAIGSDHLVLFMDAALPPVEGDTRLAPERFRPELALEGRPELWAAAAMDALVAPGRDGGRDPGGRLQAG